MNADRKSAEYFVDVRDVARLHAAALLVDTVDRKRVFAYASPMNQTSLIATLRRLRPRNVKIPDPPIGEGSDISDVKPAREAEQLLKDFFWCKRMDHPGAEHRCWYRRLCHG